jgi:His-Xaa-Ser system protein HxsD
MVADAGQQLRAWTMDGQRVAIALDTSIYAKEAILRAAYKYTDHSYVFLATDDETPGSIIVILTPKDNDHPLTKLIGDFSNELIDQQLRYTLQQEFGPIQTLITAQAFSDTNLLDPTQDDGSYQVDPHRIGQRR